MLPSFTDAPLPPPPPGNVVAMPTRVPSVGGIMPLMSLAQMDQMARAKNQANQQQPAIQGLAAHVRTCWNENRLAKEQTVEPRMLQSLRQRKGEYDPDKLALIRKQGGSEIFMMLTSAKCRGASAWLRDSLLGTGAEKPWTVGPSPMPTLPPNMVAELRVRAIDELAAYQRVTGQTLQGSELREYLSTMREEFVARSYEEARAGTKMLEQKMEDQLEEGGFRKALSEFIDDLVTFPGAIISGPIVRKVQRLKWVPPADGGDSWTAETTDEIILEWERVDPLMVYPSPGAVTPDDGNFIVRRKLRPHELEGYKGTPGFSDAAIDAALEDYQRGGLNEWLFVDTERAIAEGRGSTTQQAAKDPLIDAIQFWGHVSGQMLVDWGMPREQVGGVTKHHHAEVWLIGRHVIKAVLNPDKLGRRPYYKTCYEKIPGAFWGNAIPDLIRDDQDMCNSSARAIQNNEAIASGPQVGVNVDRLPHGYQVTEMYPWKIHQFTSDPMGSTADALHFFQPQSNVQELMAVYEKFSVAADEHSNIPRYMTGDSPAGGAGRTASGFSMLQGNAMKGHKQILMNVDVDILEPIVGRLHYTNMRSPLIPGWMKRDLQVKARGASGVLAKESLQLRRNEFLVATANPIDSQIMGPEGRGAVLREQARTLDMDVDRIVPNPARLKFMRTAAQAMQEQAAPGGGETLADGTPVTDNFSPT